MESKWKRCHTAVLCEDEAIKYMFKLLGSDATHTQTPQPIKETKKSSWDVMKKWINDFKSFCKSPGLSFADS